MTNTQSRGATSSFAEFMRGVRSDAARAYVRGDAGPLTDVSTRRDPASFFPPGPGYIEGAERVIDVNQRGAQQFGAPTARPTSKFCTRAKTATSPT